MLILFGRTRGPIVIKPPLKRCEFVEQVQAYVDRQLAPELVGKFEMHLMDCTTCRQAVQFGRLMKKRSSSHNTSDGKPCASPNRRKP